MAFASLLGIALASLASASGVGAQAASRPTPEQRWRAMPEAEREKLRRAFDEYRKLPIAEKEAARARAREIARERDRIASGISPKDRAALAALGEGAEDAWVNHLLRSGMHRRAGALRTLLPPDQLRSVREMPWGKRRAELGPLAERATRNFIERSLEHASPEERARIEALPLRDGAREALEVRKRTVVARLDVHPERRPSTLDEREWSELRELPADRFFERLETERAISGDRRPEASRPSPPFESWLRARARKVLLERGTPEDEARRVSEETPLGPLLREFGGPNSPRRFR
ncbi:MAG TPA: hypothetical protein VKE69_02590 [Planctomycetota bacterium]|nr:hypothetical protein [Planctomycetota bacterium]